MRMTEFDSFSTQLLEESKALLEKAKSAEPFTQSAYLHAGLLLTMSALEACVNSMAEELLIEPYGDSYTVYERKNCHDRGRCVEGADIFQDHRL